MTLSPSWRKVAFDDAITRQVSWFRDFPGFIDQAMQEIAAGRPMHRGRVTPISFVPADVLTKIQHGVMDGSRERLPPTPIVPIFAARDRELYHALRGGQKWAGREDMLALVAEEAKNLPRWADIPDVLWLMEKSPRQLILAKPIDTAHYMTVVILLNAKEGRKSEVLNWVQIFEIGTRTTMTHLVLLRGQWKSP